ncbi:MAG: hypothetical protein QW035_02035 [Candidatus Anstonellales archaeon]
MNKFLAVGVFAVMLFFGCIDFPNELKNETQNITNETNESLIDSTAPYVAEVEVSDKLITKADAGGVFRVSVRFSESMDREVEPSIRFSRDLSHLLLPSTEGWIDEYSYAAEYMIGNAGLEAEGFDIIVTGARDLAGNENEEYVERDAFSIDNVGPKVALVEASDSKISTEDVGGTLAVRIRYSEKMGKGNPSVVFSPDMARVLAFKEGSWISDNDYEMLYSIKESSFEAQRVDAQVSGGRDSAGNLQEEYSGAVFMVDMIRPYVVGLEISDDFITRKDIGKVIEVRVKYSEPMEASEPSIEFSKALKVLGPKGGSWINELTYVAKYEILDKEERATGLDIKISGAKDVAGNRQQEWKKEDVLDINTEKTSSSGTGVGPY